MLLNFDFTIRILHVEEYFVLTRDELNNSSHIDTAIVSVTEPHNRIKIGYQFGTLSRTIRAPELR